jgi:hypothetical protein
VTEDVIDEEAAMIGFLTLITMVVLRIVLPIGLVLILGSLMEGRRHPAS